MPIPPKMKGELAGRWPQWAAGEARRQAAARKMAIYGEDYLPLLQQYIHDTVGRRDSVVKFIQRLCTRSPNLLKSVVDGVAVAFGRGCTRELRGLGADASKAFQTIVAESGINRVQGGINARSWLQGPVLCAPRLDSKNRLALDLANSDSFDVVRERDYIEQAVWWYQGYWIELTDQAWNIWDADGAFVQSAPHGVKECPAVAYTSIDNSADWWSQSDHNGLIDATMLVGFKAATGSWVRWVSGNKLTVVAGNTTTTAEGQTVGHPSLPLVVPEGTEVNVHDRVVSAKDYLEEIAAIVSMAISAEGIPPASVAMSSGNQEWGSIALAVEPGRLGSLRDKQCHHLREHELRLWPLVCDYLRGTSHRLAGKLPKGDEVRDALRIQFPDLSSNKDALERIEVMKAGLPYGLSSPVDVFLQARPELTREEAEEEIRSNITVYLDTIEPLVTRNISKTPPEANGAQTVSQEQGRTGGQASGESRRNAAAEEAANDGA